MWSSNLPPSSGSTARTERNFLVPTSSPQTFPIPVLEDGTLELDLGRHNHAERIAPAPLQFSGFPQSAGLNASSESVRVYVSQQGHTVKLAHLQALPSSYPSQSRTSKEQLNNFGRKNRKSTSEHSSIMSHSRHWKPAADNIQSVRNQRKKSQPETEEYSSINANLKTHDESSKDDTRPLKLVPKTQQTNHLNALDNPDPSVSDEGKKDWKKTESLKQPSIIKDELNSGLKKIMSDLAALDLPSNQTQNEKAYHEESLSFEGNFLNSDHCKENNSPLKLVQDNQSDRNYHQISEETWPAKSFPVTQHTKITSNNNTRSMQTSKFDSKRSSASSLNSALRVSSRIEPNDEKDCKHNEKRKSYDPEKAREYIRQQKQERLNRLRAEREQQQADKFARKQKLDELSRTSLKLVKANVKRKLSQPCNKVTEDQSVDSDAESHNPKPLNESINESFETPMNECNSQTVPLDPSPNRMNDYSISHLPLSLDDSNAKLIKDICDMKSKIEAMANSLKTTIEANRVNCAMNNERIEHENKQLKSVADSSVEGIIPRSINLSDSKKLVENTKSPYLQSLTSNLRKMRESLQNVLSQSDLHPQELSAKSKSATTHSAHPKHRCLSNGSDSAFEAIQQTSKLKEPSLHRLSSNLQRKKITSSFPTLPTAESQSKAFDQNNILRRNSESESCQGSYSAKILNISEPADDFVESFRRHHSYGIKERSSDLYEPLTSKPYPVNFITAVKRKLSASSKTDEHEVLSSPYDNNQEIFSIPNPPDYVQLKTSTNLPPFVTSRRTSRSTNPWSETHMDELNSSVPKTDLMVESQSHDRLLHVAADEQPLQQIAAQGSSILDALNLEKMQAEFASALNPSSVKSCDITPAEKPLSAPNTPAKTSLKLKRPSLGRSGRLNLDQRTLIDVERVCPDNLVNSKSKLTKTSNYEVNCELIPPNVHLASSRIERKPDSVDSWVSHSRGTGNIGDSHQEESVSSVQTQLSSRETFDMGHVFNPTALHLQFQAELNILDSFNESLCQVMEIEKVRALALARHQAVSEIQCEGVAKVDRATDIQTSLLKSNSEISTINYKRGSGSLNDVTLLAPDSDGKTNTSSFPSLKDGHVSPCCTVASDTIGSLIKEKIFDSSPTAGTADDKNSTTGVQSMNSIEKSISEDILTMSDSVPEVISPKPEADPSDSNIAKEGKFQDLSRGQLQDLLDNSKSMNPDGSTPRFDHSVNLSVNSVKADSTFTGYDALIIETPKLNEEHAFPTIVSGEDMFQFNLQMLEQLMHEEELRVQHRTTLMKLRVKVLGEMARTEVAALDLDKKKLREKGQDGHKDQMTALRKKQRGIMLRYQQQRDDIERLRQTEELAWQERRLMYLQQMHLIRMQISTHVMLHKFEKRGSPNPKKNKVVVKSIQDNKSSRATQKTIPPDFNSIAEEVQFPLSLAVTQSSSVSMASLASEGSKSSALSNSSRKTTNITAGGHIVIGSEVVDNGVGAAGDSESSHLEERVLKGLNELQSRCRNFKEREKVLYERKQSVEQIIQWRRKLEDEERRLRDVERQAHSRHRSTLAKHMLRDRSTSPFQFLDNGAGCGTGNTSNGSAARAIIDVSRNGRNNNSSVGVSVSGSASVTEDIDSSIPEDIAEQTNGTNAEHYANESFESEASEMKTQESQSIIQDGSQIVNRKEQIVKLMQKPDSENETRLPKMSERSNKYPGITIKVPLSPRLQRVQRRRYSSGSDDSMVLSQTETGSEQSDIEGRISALSEQLHQCKAEAERLRREAKRTRNERLIAKEQSLHKQLQAYESYISQLRRNLEAELKQSSVPIVRPQIKQPRVSPGKVASRRQDAELASSPGADLSSLHTTSPETPRKSSPRYDIETEHRDIETASEAVSAVVSEGASEIASEATSEVPSEVLSEVQSEVPSDVASDAASEVSENSSLVSQDAPSLVAIKDFKEESLREDTPPNKKERMTENDCTTNGSHSEIVTSNKSEETSFLQTEPFVKKLELDKDLEVQSLSEIVSVDVLNQSNKLSIDSDLIINKIKDNKCDHQRIERQSNEEDNSSEKTVGALSDRDITVSSDQVKTITTDEELQDVSDNVENDPGHAEVESAETNLIRVYMSEKGKECPSTEEGVQPLCTAGKSRDEIVDIITNNLMNLLLGECLRSATPTHTPSQDAVFSKVVNTSLHEATNDILSIYKRRIMTASNPTKGVRQRVIEILAETSASSKLRTEGRIKELMTTTYGVISPEDSPCCSPSLSSSPIQSHAVVMHVEDSDTTYNKMAENSHEKAMKNDVGKATETPMGLIGEHTIDSEGFAQEWFDEDFGLTRSRREAEELRRQQLQIEQEIEQLQQQQAQVQEQIPYYYVREIPNKPPPPYTPPGQAPRVLSSSTTLTSAVEEARAVCTDRPVILKAIASAVDMLYDAHLQGLDLQSQEAPSSFIDSGLLQTQISHLSEQETSVHQNSAKVYRRFLYDLAKELVLNAYSSESEDPNPPWLRPENSVRRKKALTVVPKTREMLHEVVSRQVLVLFGFVPKASKENLTIRWSRKKRDHVDELLVRESQEEERQWTNYEQDEAVVKNNVALAILDSLLDDTVQVLGDVYRRREQRQHCTVY
ncbi:Centrosome-associated protein 350 [Frankliniella fusca]|uniref:Centrosome-associated protein 350 n=1 Tax=Frankliniella fusca TaxID=407009 RepID=A0AAE1LHD0_9NEOP|nr:Centrosome-associated protein 350 [Frankliniella fusca]